VFLKQPGGRHGVTGQDVFAHDLRRHYGDQRDGKEEQARHGERGEDFNQREAALTRGPAGRSGTQQYHRTDRATVMLWV